MAALVCSIQACTVYQAALMDPATAAALPTDEIVALCDELIEAHADYLPASIVRG